jgi:hypothetical protein
MLSGEDKWYSTAISPKDFQFNSRKGAPHGSELDSNSRLDL